MSESNHLPLEPADAQPTSQEPIVVGIGASAGGLAALKALFVEMPQNSGLAFVIVVHLSPERESYLADLLQPHVSMPVRQVTETMLLEPNHIYVISPGCNLNTIDTHLRLSALEEKRRERAPIDHFFRTLAVTHDGHAIGVILTGTGSDGTLGIKEIKERGGLTVVQDPSEAEYDGMPQSAITTGLVDLVLPLARIPQEILRYTSTQPNITVPEDGEDLKDDEHQLLQKIFAQMRVNTGRDFSRYKRSTIMRRIRRRMQLTHIEMLEGYLDYLRRQRNEVHALADELLITVTNFFRDAAVFEALEREIIPRLFTGKTSDETVRVWSVGCATGEEAYSLAMLLLEQTARCENPPQIQIFATDLHVHSLQKAREGFYPGDIETNVSAERLRRFFTKEDGGYRINKEVRELVLFASHNLLSDPPFSKLDFIVCRNVLIYLQREIQQDAIELFHYALNPESFLVLGTAEALDRSGLFRIENKQHCFYRKRNVPAQEPRLPVLPLSRVRLSDDPAEQPRRAEALTSYGRLHQQMVELYAPPSLLVNPDHQVVHLSEHVGRYLVHPGGEFTSNVFKLIREELRLELRAALHTLSKEGSAIQSKPISVMIEDVPRSIILNVRPAEEQGHQGFTLVIFDERKEVGPAATIDETSKGTACELEAELELTKQRLKGIIEEYETSQEEMKASNEELQSMNEELRSTLEELETSKEELQSMNEELSTLNQENRHKVEELSQLSSDLQNLLTATDIATLFLDRHLRILRFTPQVGELFNIRPADRGRPISDLTHRLGYEDLVDDARRVLTKLIPIEHEVQDEAGRWYLTRVLPYRSSQDRIEGVVITFIEITERKQAEETLRESEARLRRVLDIDGVGVLFFAASGNLVDANDAFLQMTGYTRSEVAAHTLTWRTLTPPEWVQVSFEQLQKLEATGRIGPYEKEYFCKDGSRKWMMVAGASLGNGIIVEHCIDVSDRKATEQALCVAHDQLVEADRRKDAFLATLAHGLRNPLAPIRNALAVLRLSGEDTATAEQMQAMMERQIAYLTRLVDDLLDVSRISRGIIDLRKEPMELVAVIHSAIENSKPFITAAHHRLDVALPVEPLYLEGDPVRLEQIVINLLNNAAKFTEKGGQIDFTVRREEEYAIVSVRDNGIGIDADFLPQIFEMFIQEDRSVKRTQSGLGIGLALVKILAKLHGGSVEAHSEGPGKGAEFIVRLPLAPAHLAETARGACLAATSLAGLRVLVVDDNRDAADSLGMLLSRLDAEVQVVHDGPAALALLASYQPSVVLLDIGMPEMDGYEVAWRIREKFPKYGGITLVALTGWGRDEDRQRTSAAGFDHHLTKPVDIQALQALLANAKSVS